METGFFANGRFGAGLVRSIRWHVGILGVSFSALILGSAAPARAQKTPSGCSFAGAAASMTRFPPSSVDHGEQICYRVTYSNEPAGVNCELRNFTADVFLPDGTIIPIFNNATILSG